MFINLQCSFLREKTDEKMAVASVNYCFRLAFQRRLHEVTTLLLVWMYLYISPGCCTNCSLPESWDGRWFVSEFAHYPVMINSSANSIFRHSTESEENFGECIWSDGNGRFVFRNNEAHCSKCILFTEKHINVLQTRETICEYPGEEDETQTICDYLESSELYFTWIRHDYKPIDCPFHSMSFTFSYDKSGGPKCETPISHSSSCMDSTKLEFQYESCHTVDNSEGKDEHLTCVGSWTESGYEYFIANSTSLNNRGHQSLEDRFRCYVYQSISQPHPVPSKPNILLGYQMGISDSATCTGLHNPREAGTTLYLEKDSASSSEEKCSFPGWLASHKWMDMGTTVEFQFPPQLKNRRIHIQPMHHSHNVPNSNQQQSSRKSTFFPLSHSILDCVLNKNISEDTNSHVAVIGKYSVGCKIDEICLHFVQRSDFIFQMYYMEQDKMDGVTLREKCFSADLTELRKGATMISTKGRKKPCPNPGRHLVKQASKANQESPINPSLAQILTSGQGEWSVGCSQENDLEVIPSPNSISSERMTCTDGWEDNAKHVTYTIVELNKVNENYSMPSQLLCMKTGEEEKTENLEPNSDTVPMPHLAHLTIVTNQDCIFVDHGNVLDAKFAHGYLVELINHGTCNSINETTTMPSIPYEPEQQPVVEKQANRNSSETVSSASSSQRKVASLNPLVISFVFILSYLALHVVV